MGILRGRIMSCCRDLGPNTGGPPRNYQGPCRLLGAYRGLSRTLRLDEGAQAPLARLIGNLESGSAHGPPKCGSRRLEEKKMTNRTDRAKVI